MSPCVLKQIRRAIKPLVSTMPVQARFIRIAKAKIVADMVAATGTMDIAKDAVNLLKLHPEMRSKINAK